MRPAILAVAGLAILAITTIGGVTAIDRPDASVGDAELLKLLKSRHEAASTEMEARKALYPAGRVALDDVCGALERFALAGTELAETPAERVKYLESALESAKFIEAAVTDKYKNEVEPLQAMARATYTRADLEIKLYRARKVAMAK